MRQPVIFYSGSHAGSYSKHVPEMPGMKIRVPGLMLRGLEGKALIAPMSGKKNEKKPAPARQFPSLFLSNRSATPYTGMGILRITRQKASQPLKRTFTDNSVNLLL